MSKQISQHFPIVSCHILLFVGDIITMDYNYTGYLAPTEICQSRWLVHARCWTVMGVQKILLIFVSHVSHHFISHVSHHFNEKKTGRTTCFVDKLVVHVLVHRSLWSDLVLKSGVSKGHITKFCKPDDWACSIPCTVHTSAVAIKIWTYSVYTMSNIHQNTECLFPMLPNGLPKI